MLESLPQPFLHEFNNTCIYSNPGDPRRCNNRKAEGCSDGLCLPANQQLGVAPILVLVENRANMIPAQVAVIAKMIRYCNCRDYEHYQEPDMGVILPS